MKLRLHQEKGLSVLDLLEDLEDSQTPAVIAGIKNLFHSGKNQIIINLTEAKKVSLTVLTELIKLHQAARELNGHITLVGKGELVKQAIDGFSVPPVIKYFATVDAALSSFEEEHKAKPKDVAKKSAIPDPVDDLQKEVHRLQEENKVLTGKVANSSSSELKKVKKENSELKEALKQAEQQLEALLKDRKKPSDVSAATDKINQLEALLEQYTQKDAR